MLYLCLQKDNLLAHVPLHIKQASHAAEESITRKLYADYSTFKKKLYHNIVDLNPQYDKLVLFKKTQKLLDRFLFIFFAEDRLLLPPNSVREILKQWQQLTELDNYVPLYDRFKKYFGYLNTGHKGKLYEIFAYNGGLFATDEVLETIIIDDDTLYQSCITISNYDFDTEVDVNILGHIFEHSLNEIEELQAELDGTAIDKTKTKRKKDGVFYTPRYITKYIVENTVGSLCNAKKAELKIVDDEFTTEKRKANKKKLLTQIDTYRQWLLQLTICDPACGSGAFLNQVLDFLLAEHRYVDELKAKLFGDSIVYSDVEKEILENNLFGVDINEEAVEIARLSLWLRTAHKGRKLNNLSNNIKCGNSLIDDATVAGDKAFNWQKEFPQVFGEYVEQPTKAISKTIQSAERDATIVDATETIDEDKTERNYTERITNRDNTIINTDFNIVNEPAEEYGIKKEIKNGFDVIIGNPPYVNAMELKKTQTTESYSFLKSNYKTAKGTVDLYIYFFERGLSLLKENGLLSFITPNRFLSASYGVALREFLIDNYRIVCLIDYSDKAVFEDASTYPVISIIGNQKGGEYFVTTGKFNDESKELVAKKFPSKRLQILEDSILGFLLNDKLKITEKIFEQGVSLDACGKINATSTAKEADDYSILINKTNGLRLLNTGTIDPYFSKWGYEYLTDKGVKYLSPLIDIDSPVISENRRQLYQLPKIIISKIGLQCEAFFDKNGEYASINTNCIHSFTSEFIPEYILCWLNSKLYNYTFECLFDGLRMSGGYLLYSAPNLRNTAIKKISPQQQLPFIEKANTMLAKNEELQKVQSSFLILLQSKFENLQLNKKLSDWHNLTFGAFMKELEKQKIKLSLQEQAEWMPFFEAEKEKALEIIATINETDKTINDMVYALYELTDDEIKVVEGT